MINILFVGAGDYPMYETAFYNACAKIDNIEADLFTWNGILKDIKFDFIRRMENKISCGPHIKKINNILLQKCEKNVYDIVFLYSCRLITEKTIIKLKQKGIYIAVYNNDNPFATYYPRYFWRNYIKSIKHADMTYIYRKNNIEDCIKHGAKKIELLRAYYIESRNYLIDEKDKISVPDVLFLGHQEADERQEYIKALLDEKIYVGVPESAWSNFEKGNPYLILLKDTQNLYNTMLNSTKIAIVFLSKINHDTYTRRCFEIPVTQTLMVAPYTADIADMFQESKEVVLYKNKQDFVEKIKYFLEHDKERKNIANAGYRRVLSDGHEASDRVRQIVDNFEYDKRLNK